MSSSTPDRTRAAVLTVSDSCSRGEKSDRSGPAVAEALQRRNCQVVAVRAVLDGREAEAGYWALPFRMGFHVERVGVLLAIIAHGER